MQSLNDTTLAALSGQKLVFEVKSVRHEKAHESARSEKQHDFDRSKGGRRRGAHMFQHEVMLRFKQKFSASLKSQLPPQSTVTPDSADKEIASSIVSAARRITATQLDDAPSAMQQVRAAVGEAENASTETAVTDDEQAGIVATRDEVNAGLDKIEKQVAAGEIRRLEFRSRHSESTRLQIRTREGDLVSFDVRQTSRVKISDEQMTGTAGSASSTSLHVSESSRIRLRVEGDLNASEREAIRGVFDAAEKLAEKFFGGDMSAALEIAAALEIDHEQLARVSMKFRSVLRVNAQQSTRTSAPASAPVHDSATRGAMPESGPKPAAPLAAEVSTGAVNAPDITTAPIPTAEAAEESAVVDNVSAGLGSGFDSLIDFLGQLAAFLEQSFATDGTDDAGLAGKSDMRFEFSQSFKLEILHAVMQVAAPPEVSAEDTATGESIRLLDENTLQLTA